MAEPLRLLVVDDEPPARARLRRLLAALPGVQVVGEAGSGLQALALAESLRPDALLLDVQMPELSGLDVAASLPDAAQGGPAVVFVTAYDDYALPAFDAAALDYLLKPVDPERLARALQRLRARRLPAPPASAAASTAAPPPTPPSPHPARPAPAHLLIPDLGRTHVVPLAQILWLEAADNYVVVHTAERAPLMRRTLTALLADLGEGFVRTHRSAAVALAQVQAVHVGAKGDATVRLAGGGQAPCSRQHRAALMARLQGR